MVLDGGSGGRTLHWDGKAPISRPGLFQASSSPGPYHLLELLDPSLEGWRSRRGSESGLAIVEATDLLLGRTPCWEAEAELPLGEKPLSFYCNKEGAPELSPATASNDGVGV